LSISPNDCSIFLRTIEKSLLSVQFKLFTRNWLSPKKRERKIIRFFGLDKPLGEFMFENVGQLKGNSERLQASSCPFPEIACGLRRVV
jgi:hypothetical protein